MTARQPLARTVLAACLLVIAFGCTRMPADNSAEAGFARDMATHHAQAVEMGFIIRDATKDERLRTLAADIIVTQSAQRGMFMSWLQTWGLPQASPGPRMAWMGSSGDAHATGAHDAMAGMPGMPLMAGMASDAELEALRHATGRDAEVLFLQLMIRHHEGGVLMARALLARSNRQDVVTLVRGIEAGQTGEIKTMTEMLAERGARPYPSLLN
jgi:uncharacterized protein (DUF305 family)